MESEREKGKESMYSSWFICFLNEYAIIVDVLFVVKVVFFFFFKDMFWPFCLYLIG